MLGDSRPIEGQILVRTEDDRWVVLRDANSGPWAIELGPEDAFWWWQSGEKLVIGRRDPNAPEKILFNRPTPSTEPDLNRPNSSPDAIKMTGTDGPEASISNPFAHHVPTGGDADGRDLSDSDVMPGSNAPCPMDRNSLKIAALDASGREETDVVARVGDGIRTRDIQIHNLVP